MEPKSHIETIEVPDSEDWWTLTPEPLAKRMALMFHNIKGIKAMHIRVEKPVELEIEVFDEKENRKT